MVGSNHHSQDRGPVAGVRQHAAVICVLTAQPLQYMLAWSA